MLEGVTLNRRYRLDRRIGGGAGGTVYQATDLEAQRDLAVRVISLASGAGRMDGATLARCRERAAAAARLRHPNLVTVHEFGTSESLGLDFVVMELLRGENLRQRTGQLPWEQVFGILHDAALGLGAGHRAGLVHAGVRPASLFMEYGAEGRLPRMRVLDLGTVRPGDAQKGGELNPYAAPEQHRGHDGLTPATDVWSLAVIAYEMLAGRLPFTAQQLAALARGTRVRADAPSTAASGIPPAADDLVARALSLDPEQRPADGQAFARELDDIRRGVHPAAAPEPRSFAPSEPPAARAALGLEGTRPAGPAAPPSAAAVPPASAGAHPPEDVAAGTPRRGRGVRGMVVATLAAAVIAVLTITAAGRATESAEEYLAAARPIEAARAPRPGEIDHAATVFDRIDNRGQTIREWRMELGRVRRFEWPSSDSAHATVYEDRNGIQKIRVRAYQNGERVLSLLFYYDHANKLVFVFDIRPSGTGRRAEQRFYFSDRALIRWKDTRNEIVPPGPAYDPVATRLHRISDRLFELAARSR